MARSCNILLLLVACLASAASGQNALQQALGGYLPPVNEEPQCYPSTRYTTVQQFQTTTVFQPFTQVQSQTRFAQALATATMAVTTTMQRVENQVMRVPVTRTYEVTATSVTTRVQQIPFQPPAVTSAVTSTAVRVQTQTNNQFVTQTQTRVTPVFITMTRFNTQFATSNVFSTQVRTTQVTQRNVERTFTSTQQVARTQQLPQPAFTSVVQTQIVQTSQFVNFQTPRPVTRTQFETRQVFSTQFSNVVQTQQAVATQQVVRTQAQTVTNTQVQTITSTQIMNQQVVRTSIVNRIVTSTQVIPQVITSTRVENRFNTQFVTSTITQQVVQTQTIRGQNQFRTQLVTSFQNVVRTETAFQQANPVTITQTVSQACQQQQQQQVQVSSGYNYNQPGVPFNVRG